MGDVSTQAEADKCTGIDAAQNQSYMHGQAIEMAMKRKGMTKERYAKTKPNRANNECRNAMSIGNNRKNVHSSDADDKRNNYSEADFSDD